MSYTAWQHILRKNYNASPEKVFHDEASGISVMHVVHNSLFNIEFSSGQNTVRSAFFNQPDLYDRNMHFSYPVVRPQTEGADRKAVILLHGLNERSWDKYLAWAFSLAEITGKSVILFPIAFHMNRSPEDWRDPRFMHQYVEKRVKEIPGVKSLSFANVALSERLTMQPQQFFFSGYQSANDLIQLTDSLKSGDHPLFQQETTIDFFAYSIGVLLSQVLLLANPDNRFSRSKFFFFSGGSVFEGMHGISRHILDDRAFGRIFHFYCDEVAQEKKETGLFADLLNQTALGKAFLAMTSFRNLKNMKGKIFRKLKGQVEGVCLKNDLVIPPEQVIQTMKGANVEEWDLPYRYSHENPFPLFGNSLSILVDRAFDKVFTKAGLFLT